MTLGSPIYVCDHSLIHDLEADSAERSVQNQRLRKQPSTIKTISECFIKAKYVVEEPKDPIYLAPWDLFMLSFNYIQKGLLFPSPFKPNFIHTILDRLKDSLSLALVHFYPLAGRLETQVDETEKSSLIYVNPNKGPGARFIHAAATNLTISDILSPTDVPQVVQSFFDHHKAVNHDGHTRPLLTVQFTELIDGVFLGISVNHVCADGTSFWHFLNVWSEIHMRILLSNNIDDLDVSILNSISRPPIHNRWFLDQTGPIIKLPFTHRNQFIAGYEHDPSLRERVFHFTPESIVKLKAKANSDCGTTNKISSFQSLSALVWRCITRARRCPHNTQTRCMLAVNNRARLCPPLSQDYFGNAVEPTKAVCVASELLGHSLGWAAHLLNDAVARHTNEVVREALRRWIRDPFVYRLGETFDPFSVMMGSSPRFDMYGNEFGMGKPMAVRSGYANKFDGKTTSYPGREGGGSVDLEICLLPRHMEELETDPEFMEAVV